MIEALHRFGSSIRRSRLLRDQGWLWSAVEPRWQRAFGRLTREAGYPTRVNEDVFRLVYEHGARYDRADNMVYEPHFYGPFVERVRPGMAVFDVGAHIGMFTLGAAKRIGDGRVYAFEPAPQTYDILRRHVAYNGWEDRVEAVQAVVSDTEGTMPFYVYGLSMAASLGRDNVALSPEQFEQPIQEIQVASVTLDAFCAERGVEPDLVKIDVEGAELRVLRGAERVLREVRPVILCEIHPHLMENLGDSEAELRAFLNRLGYALTPLSEPNPAGIFHGLIARREPA
jgi:FkbM family methyltransferase